MDLWLIARFVSPEEAMRVARIYMLQWHDLGQTPFASLLGRVQVEDATIRDCQDWLADHYTTPSPVAEMIARAGLAKRTFVRRFAKATGLTPLDYVHALRLEEAKQMLETGTAPVEAVAHEVGYEDPSFFNCCLHVVVYPASRHTAKDPERVPVGIEQHLMSLQRVT